MRYIKKNSSEPECLSEYKAECKRLEVKPPLLYRDFNRTGELRNILTKEQHNVCCYCQRAVKGFRIEHSYPENSPDKATSESLQLDYNNLFASCIDSEGFSTDAQHCDVSKANHIIREFIKEENCQNYFRYLSTGEIIPNGAFSTWKEYENSSTLSQDEQDALNAIKVLNLNCPELKEKRKTCIDLILSLLHKKTKQEWNDKIQSWLNSDTFPDFIELRLQYITQHLENISK